MHDALQEPGKEQADLAAAFNATVDPKDAALENVQSALESEIEKRREERFYWIAALIFLFDTEEFRRFETWSGPIIIGVIQILILIALGRRLGVDHIWTVTEKLIDRWSDTFGRKEH